MTPRPPAKHAASATSCQLRLRGFAANGITDPAPYVGRRGRRKTPMLTLVSTRRRRRRPSRSSRSSARRSRARAPRRALPTHFVRLGGCDYRCSWCDTMYAVDPATVRATSSAAERRRRSSRRSRALARRASVGQHQRRQSGAASTRPARRRTCTRPASWWRSRRRGRCGATGSATVDRLTVSPKATEFGDGERRDTSGGFEEFMHSARERGALGAWS